MQASSLTANGHTYTSISGNLDTDLQNAITNGTPVTVSGPVWNNVQIQAREINGRGSGWLVGGCPLNILFGQGWLPGQILALKNAGITPGCLVPGSPEYIDFWSNPEGTPQPGEAIGSTGSTQQGGVVQLTPTQSSTVAAAISTQLTPGAPGGVPAGNTVGQTFGPGTSVSGPPGLYRFILESAPGRFDTGANYNGCSAVNSMMCDPQQFVSLAAAVAYAVSRKETPYMVNSAAEVWGIINGTVPLNTSQIVGANSAMSPLVIGGVALLAYLLLK